MKSNLKVYAFIIIIAVIVSIPLFYSKYDIYIDDGIQHVCRIMGTYQSITEGQNFPVIMSNFCNEFGYSWNLFYSPVTAYIPLIFHLITNSFVLDIKIFMLFVTILTGIAMYSCIYTITKNKSTSLLAAAIYMLAPYRLTDMYIRMALAELTSFIFLPMIFQGLYLIFYGKQIETKKPEILLILGAVGLILSHLVIAMYTVMIAFIYLLFHIKKMKEKIVLKKLLISFIFIILLSSFFLLPMLEQKMNANYEVFQPGRMERTDALIYHKLNLLDFIYTQQGNMVFEIGLITLVGLFLTILAYPKIEKRHRKIYVLTLILGIISLIMSLKYFPFEKLPAILKMLQFSFRMLEFSSFFFAMIVAVNFSVVIKNFGFKDVIILTGMIVLLLVPMAIRNIPYREGLREEYSLWPAVRVTMNTKRVHAGCASFEYLPSRAFKNLDYIKIRENKVYVLEGESEILNEEKVGTDMTFKIINSQKGTRIELPYIYYSGYEAKLNMNGIDIILPITESENGFTQIILEQEVVEGNITISYPGTRIMKISTVISILGFSTMILYACWKTKNK